MPKCGRKQLSVYIKLQVWQEGRTFVLYFFMSSCKMNYNGLSNVYTFLPFVGFKKFFLTSAPIELYCAVLEGTIKSTIPVLIRL